MKIYSYDRTAALPQLRRTDENRYMPLNLWAKGIAEDTSKLADQVAKGKQPDAKLVKSIESMLAEYVEYASDIGWTIKV
jgi:hypothetical protein